MHDSMETLAVNDWVETEGRRLKGINNDGTHREGIQLPFLRILPHLKVVLPIRTHVQSRRLYLKRMSLNRS